MPKKPMLAAFALAVIAIGFTVYHMTTGADRLPPVAALPEAGDSAPDFSLPDQNGNTHRLSDYRGKTLLIAFYPADFTPGCSLEAHTMTANYQKLIGSGPDPHRRQRAVGRVARGILP